METSNYGRLRLGFGPQALQRNQAFIDAYRKARKLWLTGIAANFPRDLLVTSLCRRPGDRLHDTSDGFKLAFSLECRRELFDARVAAWID